MDSKGNRESEETKAKYVPLNQKLEEAKGSFEPSEWKKRCIYRAPWCLRGQGDKNGFRPHLVSIGPYHHGDPRLERMQFHKYRMLDLILKRTGKDIREFYDAIEDDLEHKARDCYEDLPEASFCREQFVELLVLDGCFILDFLVGRYAVEHTQLGYGEEDPIFCKLYMCHGILMDMTLLENQIPLFILNRLYVVQFNLPHTNKVVDLMFLAFHPGWVTGIVPKSETELHILSSSKLREAGNNSMPGSCLEAFWQNLKYDPTESKPKSEMALWESMMELVKGIWGYMMALGSQESRAEQGRGNQESMADHERANPDVDDVPNVDYVTLSPELIRKASEEAEDMESIYVDVDVVDMSIPTMQSGENPDDYMVVGMGRSADVVHLPSRNEEGSMKGARTATVDEEVIRKQIANVSLMRDLKQHVVSNVIALKEAGVVFKHKNGTPFWARKFDRGVLEIPQIVMTEWSESVFLNLMAFELRHIEEKEYKILPYVLFMDSLVNSAADVDELRASGVIVSSGLSDKELADIFNRLGRKPVAIEFRDQELIQNINEYCNRRIHQWRANLMHNYFNNPWAIISVVAAAFLMLLTFAQTYYTIASYYQSP